MPDVPFTIFCVTGPVDAGPGPAAYLARDSAGRPVEMQFLEVAGEADFERLQRETLAASALTHGKIVRVLDMGEWAARPCLIREHLPGISLRARIGGKPLPVAEMLDIALQIAHTLEVTQAVGIVHRNLSAEWILVSPQGEISVSGFGYARAVGSAPACAAPEAVSGAAVDGRADLYGLGAILWEMATGQEPPASPPSPSAMRPDLPPLLEGIIRTALDPEPDKRFQTAAGLARALTLFRRGAATAKDLEHARATGSSQRRRKRIHRADLRWEARVSAFRIASLGALAAVIALLLYLLVPRFDAFQKHEARKLTSSGDVVEAALSPDATRFAMVRREAGGLSLWVRPVGGGDAVRILPPTPARCFDLTFSRDGASLLYVRAGADGSALYSVPVAGGEPQRLASGVDGAAIAPDGKRAAFLRRSLRERTVVLANLDGSDDRVVMARNAPVGPQAVAWSPDGDALVASVCAPGEGCRLFSVDLAAGVEQILGFHGWSGPVGLNFLPGGGGIMLAGPELGGASPVWRVNYPDGGATHITTDLDQYSRISLSTDGRSLATVKIEFLSALWVLPENDAGRARRITGGERPDGVDGLDWTPDGRIVFGSKDGTNRGLWIVGSDGSNPQTILTGPDRASTPKVSPDGAAIAFLFFRSGTPQIWTMTPEGKSLRPVTRGGGEYMPSFSPDGTTLYFASAQPPTIGVWKMPFGGGRPDQLSRVRADFPVVSPDGKRIALRSETPGGGEVLIIPAVGGPSETRLRMDPIAQIAWTRDSSAVVWPRVEDGVGNLWAHPIDGAAPSRLTHFTSPGEIYGFAWSRDWKQLAVSRGGSVANAVLFRDTR